MISIANINMPIEYTNDDLKRKCAKLLNIKDRDIISLNISKKSIDARKKDALCYVLKVDLEIKNNVKYNTKYITPYISKEFIIPKAKTDKKVLVIGTGPAGLFCSLVLAKAGLKPILIERGNSVEERLKDINEYFNNSHFNPKSNTIFGEGGAGTFSDGKLNTNLNDPKINFILKEFVKYGAHEDLLYNAKPHVGTDCLINVLKNMRKELSSLGCSYRFNSTLVDIDLNNVAYIENDGKIYKEDFDCLVLAIGHSARDTFEMLYNKGLIMEQKSFSMGVRIEHKREMIDKSQYGDSVSALKLGAASYKLATHLDNGRGVYTFCMCPGGMVVPANSSSGMIGVNGMSYYARDMENSNSALLVDVRTTDFESDHPLSGFKLQEKYEKLAYECSNSYKAPIQLVGDFLENRISSKIGDVKPSYPLGYVFYDLHKLLPNFVSESLEKGLLEFDKKIKGFASYDAVLTGIETRSSSPVRIIRDKNYQCNLSNIYPIGEGAGYAGGITSAALDGIHCALKIIESDVE